MCTRKFVFYWRDWYGVQWNDSGKDAIGEIVPRKIPGVVIQTQLHHFMVRRFQAAVTDLLEPFGLEESRMYINFFDMPRANVGWSRKTFAG
jgi:hypothetical protein